MNEQWEELVRLYRGEQGGREVIEASHLGAIAVVSGDGELLFSLGDVSNLTHLRSTAKPFQLLPFALRKLQVSTKLDEREIALLMASHGGEEQHVQVLKKILEKINVQESELLCGIHAPTHEGSKNALIAEHLQPNVLHNNCSGKHSAMVAVTKAVGWSSGNYGDVEHPLQREIRALLAQLSGLAQEKIGIGIDGCSAATFIMPLQSIAKLYSALSSPATGDKNLNDTLRLLYTSGTKYPEMIAGTKRLDTMLMRCSKGRLFAKTGAEGIYAIAVAPSEKYPKGLGIAIKIADGDPSHRARNAATISLLKQIDVLSEDEIRNDEELSQFQSGVLRNLRKIEVGQIKAVFQLRSKKNGVVSQ